MLQIPRRVEYALRASVYLAQQCPMEVIPFREIAASIDVPGEFLSKVLRQLANAGIVNSLRGANGGYHLARPATEISFLDVVEASDSPVAINDCSEKGVGCFRSTECALKDVFNRAEAAMVEVFANTSLSDLAHPASRLATWASPQSILAVAET